MEPEFGAIEPQQFVWITRPHEPGEPARHVAELSDAVGAELLESAV